MKIIGIIPARGGSKGVPRKNVRKIAGKPLLKWSIESAEKSKLLDEFYVSTEDEEIARITMEAGADIIPRPKKYATDKSLIIETLQHALKCKPYADAIVLLQPTSPIRNPGLIDKCIKKYKDIDVDTVVTGFDCHYNPYETYVGRRQDLDTFFYNDGNVYVISSQLIKRGRINSSSYSPIITTREENVEIDDEFDFWLAEQILLKRKKHGTNSK